ncbi:YmaF family protein [Lacrimispora sp.]|nr:YmaF family protein [Lacrimispora sp.]MDR7814758.1 YmaF family protein [Lacrimispora sp.]
MHEVQGSVQIPEREEDPHNHRFATVSGEAIFRRGMLIEYI